MTGLGTMPNLTSGSCMVVRWVAAYLPFTNTSNAEQEPTRAEFHCYGVRDRYGEIVRTWSLRRALQNGQCRALGLLKLEPHCCRSTCSGDRPLWSEKINALKVGSESAAVSES